ncbi:MAG: DUF6448 family protein [Verrucomicrobia bacterium]|nr:DUF6448 family protein [Verrucomicrobiota bacterium]
MATKRNRIGTAAAIAACAGVCLLALPAARAHGDTTDGPVVTAAKTALERGNVTLTLKWVKKDREAGIREAFQKTLAVRKLGPEAKELADKYFLETLVKIHHAGEGLSDAEPKPAGAEVEAAVAKADEALISGRVQPLAKALSDAVADGIRKRFDRAHAAKENADSSAEAGRESVEAYVEFIRYIEQVAQAAKPPAADHKH